MNNDAEFWIKKLNLTEHPEGGYYNEIYRSEVIFNDRNLVTSIYFLLKSGQVSKFHRLKSDDIWYYHIGSSLRIYFIDQKGKLEVKSLGCKEDDELSLIIKAGVIFGAEIIDTNSFSIVSCIVSPGFSFDDFKLYKSNELLEQFPQYSEIINKLS